MNCRILAGLVVIVLGGCSSTVPVLIRTAPPTELSPSTVSAAPATFVGELVRWGGTVKTVENGKTDTLIQVVARPLERGGRPRSRTASPGRFLARVPGFLDPAVYSEGRELTVAGA